MLCCSDLWEIGVSVAINILEVCRFWWALFGLCVLCITPLLCAVLAAVYLQGQQFAGATASLSAGVRREDASM